MYLLKDMSYYLVTCEDSLFCVYLDYGISRLNQVEHISVFSYKMFKFSVEHSEVSLFS